MNDPPVVMETHFLLFVFSCHIWEGLAFISKAIKTRRSRLKRLRRNVSVFTSPRWTRRTQRTVGEPFAATCLSATLKKLCNASVRLSVSASNLLNECVHLRAMGESMKLNRRSLAAFLAA